MRRTILVAAAVPAVLANPINEGRAASEAMHATMEARRSSKVGGIQGVVGLIEKLLDDTKADKEAAARVYVEFNNEICITRRTELETSLEHLEGAIEEYDGNASTALANAEEQAGIKNKHRGIVAEQEGLLEEEHRVFAELEASGKQKIVDADVTMEAVRAAIHVLKEHTGINLLQRTDIKKELTPLLGAYSAIIAALAKPETAKKYASFMQSDDDLSLVQAPQATTSAYEPSSGGIIEILENMLDDFEDVNLTNKQELTTATRNHDMSVQNMQMTKKSSLERSKDAEEGEESANADKVTNENRSSAGTTKLGAKKEMYESDKSQCQKKASEHEATQSRMGLEITGLVQCLDVFMNSFNAGREKQIAGSFLQVQQSGRVRTELVRELRELGRKLNSFGLMQLAAAAKNDPFGKIKGLIESMITRLQEEQRQEATAKANCDKDLKRQAAVEKKAKDLVRKLSARKGQRENSIMELKETIANDEEDLKELVHNIQMHDELYQDDKAFLETELELLKTDQEAMTEAIQIFKDHAPKNDAADNIATLLDQMLADMVSQEEDAQALLTKANADWQTFSAKSNADKMVSEATIKSTKATVTREDATLESTVADLTLAETEYKDASALHSSTKNACTAKVMSFADKQKRRASEIAGLQKALEILQQEGGGDADAEVFVQKSMKQTFLGYN